MIKYVLRIMNNILLLMPEIRHLSNEKMKDILAQGFKSLSLREGLSPLLVSLLVNNKLHDIYSYTNLQGTTHQRTTRKY